MALRQARSGDPASPCQRSDPRHRPELQEGARHRVALRRRVRRRVRRAPRRDLDQHVRELSSRQALPY